MTFYQIISAMEQKDRNKSKSFIKLQNLFTLGYSEVVDAGVILSKMTPRWIEERPDEVWPHQLDDTVTRTPGIELGNFRLVNEQTTT